jgi:protein SCO1/2
MTEKRVGRDFDVVVVGINPKETPELANAKLQQTLATYHNLQGTDAGWHFLTGTLDNVHSVTNPLGFYYTYDAEKDIVNHPAGIMFLTPTGVVSSYILGAQFRRDAIIANLNTAAHNQLGVKSADIFFGCIHIDPLTGKRSIVIQNVLMVLGVITVMTVALTLLTLSGKARWKRRTSTGKDEWGEPL